MAQRTAHPDPNADTHYQTLGIDFRATPSEVTRAYRSKMKAHHPDRAGPARRAEAERRAREINDAYAVLRDPARRQEYDQRMRVQEVQDQLMNRYVGGLGGPGAAGQDVYGRRLRRELTEFERAEMRRADRSATFSLLGAFLAVTVAVIGLVVVIALLATIASLFL